MGVPPADEFRQFDWHDNLVYAIRLHAADPDRGDWRSELELDIDHIVEWICGHDDSVRFRVAPASLVFHDVTDLKIAVDFGDSGNGININELSIHDIAREQLPAEQQKVCLDRPYYRWRIELNLPKGGEIAFGASGFTQTLRAEPVLTDEQRLAAAARG
jgi:hypothetical protein